MTTDTPATAAMNQPAVQLDLGPDELELVRTALRLLLATLSREEADEIDEVRALLVKLPR